MRIGFTGTAQGMSDAQRASVSSLLADCSERDEFHFGDCVGADEEAFQLAAFIGLRTIAHPPRNEYKRAFCPADEVRVAKEYLARNGDIANECEMLIAAPKEASEELRSGTWATVRYARKAHKHIWLVFPDGSIKYEDNERSEERGKQN